LVINLLWPVLRIDFSAILASHCRDHPHSVCQSPAQHIIGCNGLASTLQLLINNQQKPTNKKEEP
jgi:hypothetical protein